jgi:hypothetical protein
LLNGASDKQTSIVERLGCKGNTFYRFNKENRSTGLFCPSFWILQTIETTGLKTIVTDIQAYFLKDGIP